MSVSQKYMQTHHIVIFSKTYKILSMKYLWPSTINTQHILLEFYCLTGLLMSVDLSSNSIYNEAKNNEFYNIFILKLALLFFFWYYMVFCETDT